MESNSGKQWCRDTSEIVLTFWVLVVVVKRLQLLCVVHDRELICVKGVKGVKRCQGVEVSKCRCLRHLDTRGTSRHPKSVKRQCRRCRRVSKGVDGHLLDTSVQVSMGVEGVDGHWCRCV